MTHQMIRRFQSKGRTTLINIEQTQKTIKLYMVQDMKDQGFVPLLDVNVVWSWHWIEGDLFEFTMTWHGVYVGKEKAWKTEGISDGKPILSIPKNK